MDDSQRHGDDMGRNLLGPGVTGTGIIGRRRSSGHQAATSSSSLSLDGDYANIKKRTTRSLFVTVTCTSCMLSLYGYDFGITAWTVLSIKGKGIENLGGIYRFLEHHSEIMGLLVACVPIGGTIGGLIGRKIANSNGRKAEIRLVNLLCIMGASLEALSGVRPWDSVWLVLMYACGRVLYGIGLGLSIRVGPMYIRETVAAAFRDACTVSVKLSMVSGMIVSYLVGGLLRNTLYGYLGAVVIATVSLTCVGLMPESPLFMLLHQNFYSKAQILDAVRFTNPSAGEAEVQALEEEVVTEVLSYTPGHHSYCGEATNFGILSSTNAGFNPNRDSANTGAEAASGAQDTCAPTEDGSSSDAEGYEALGWAVGRLSLTRSMKNLPSLMKAPGMRSALVLTSGLMVCEQASGMTALLYYGGIILADIDIIPVDLGLAGLGVLQLLMAAVVMYSINPIGRKPLLLYGLGGLFVSASSLTVGGILGLSTKGRWLCLIGLYAFTIFYSISLGALVWVLVSDVFPTCHRAEAISIVSTTHFATAATFVVLLPVAQGYGGYATMFLCFMVIDFFATCFAHRFMVETKGMSLVEVQRALSLKAGVVLLPDTRTASV